MNRLIPVILLALLMLSGTLLAESNRVTVDVVNTEERGDHGKHSSSKPDQPSSEYVVTLPTGEALRVAVSNEKTKKENSEWQGIETDCNRASIGFVACENLKAQKGIHDSTEIAAHAAWFAAITGAIGACLLIYTLKETRNANEIARSANRAWCDFTLTSNAIKLGSDEGDYAFGYEIHNFGGSPAIDVRIRLFIIARNAIGAKGGADKIPVSNDPFVDEYRGVIYPTPGDDIRKRMMMQADSATGIKVKAKPIEPLSEGIDYCIAGRVDYSQVSTTIKSSVTRFFDYGVASDGSFIFTEIIGREEISS